MTHDWEQRAWLCKEVSYDVCRRCGCETFAFSDPTRRETRYLTTRPAGEQQLLCPNSCEDSLILEVLEL